MLRPLKGTGRSDRRNGDESNGFCNVRSEADFFVRAIESGAITLEEAERDVLVTAAQIADLSVSFPATTVAEIVRRRAAVWRTIRKHFAAGTVPSKVPETDDVAGDLGRAA